MKYIINKEFCFDLFNDGDVIASSKTSPKSFLLNKTAWFAVKLFTIETTFQDAKQNYISHYNKDKKFLSEGFKKIFIVLVKNNIIKGV